MMIVALLGLLLCVVSAEVFDTGFNFNLEEPIDISAYYSKRSTSGLQDFNPISNEISESGVQYYSFSVNTSTGLGENYQFLIFLTGNICSQPSNLAENETSLAVYYSFNSSMFSNFELGNMILFEYGYFEALEDVPVSPNVESQDSVLYIAVKAPENTNKTATWKYEIGVSQNDLVFQWDDRPWGSIVDTDYESALIITGNLTSQVEVNTTTLNATYSQYSLFIYSKDYKDYFDQLKYSWCAVRNGPALLSYTSIDSSYTERGGGIYQQFYVTGLNSSTKYVAYLVSDFGGTDFGGAVYQPFEFETLDTDACALIYDLEFCDQVAYSVPTNSNLTKAELMGLYDNRVQGLYSNFSKSLQQIACDEVDDAIFSPISSCSLCASKYKDWLCSVSIPRCSTRNITGYKDREIGKSRNDFINDVIVPEKQYFEVLPCVNVCQAIVRTCPADFGFACPTSNDSIRLSYYWDNGGEYPTCNYVGNSQTSSGIKRLILNWWFIIAMFFITAL